MSEDMYVSAVIVQDQDDCLQQDPRLVLLALGAKSQQYEPLNAKARR